MNIREIVFGHTYNSEVGDVRVFHIFFNEDWDEWCVQAKGADGRYYTFTPGDLEEVV
jgi:hypothetical protein